MVTTIAARAPTGVFSDFSLSAGMWAHWTIPAWHRVMLQYRQTMVGPLWITLGLTMIISVKALIFTGVLGPEDTYLAFLAFGMIFWQLMSSLIMGGIRAFSTSRATLMEGTLPLTAYALQATVYQMILFGHHLLIVPGIFFFTASGPTLVSLLVFPGLAICLINGVWVAMTLGVLQLKYRDLESFFQPLLRGMFFLTPVFWDPSIVTGPRRILVDFNPFYYFLELLRAPLLGYAPAPRVWVVCGSITLIGLVATLVLYRVQRARLAYWL